MVALLQEVEGPSKKSRGWRNPEKVSPFILEIIERGSYVLFLSFCLIKFSFKERLLRNAKAGNVLIWNNCWELVPKNRGPPSGTASGRNSTHDFTS
jgi:hypothetical protein